MADDGPDGRPAKLEANRLFAALDDETRERLRSRFELVDLDLRTVLLERDQPIEYVYFPLDAVGSLVSDLDVGRSIEIATIGCEGMIGLPVFLRSESTSAYRAFIQVPGRLWRMTAGDFREEIGNGSELQVVLQRYTQALFGQLAINVACNRAHPAEERMPRWLLMTHDRAGRDEFALTQEFMAQMLGVRRATVNEVAAALQARGLIAYSRGRVTMVDREGLEGASCECYGRVNEEFERLFPR
jgi:CRP-like cAMP-binding protein